MCSWSTAATGLSPAPTLFYCTCFSCFSIVWRSLLPGWRQQRVPLSQPAQRCLTAGSHAYTAAPHISLRSHPQALPPVDVQAAKLPGQPSACHVVANLGGGAEGCVLGAWWLPRRPLADALADAVTGKRGMVHRRPQDGEASNQDGGRPKHRARKIERMDRRPPSAALFFRV